MRKYFFGYLFVRIAKILAIIVLLVGVGYILSKYGQANIAADSASYRTSDVLELQLNKLGGSFARTKDLVGQYAGSEAVAQIRSPDFPRGIDSNGDFERLSKQLVSVDQRRQEMKETIIRRFEALVAQIEEKLRAHAATLAAGAPQPLPAPTAAMPSPGAGAIVSQSNERETLFIPNLTRYDIQARSAALERTRQMLKTLESTAENPENRRILTDSAAQLDELEKLLPSPRETSQTEPSPITTPPRSESPEPTPPPKEFSAEKVANQLRQARLDIRSAMLSSWSLDDAFEQASSIAAVERAKCRLASLTVKGIWLKAFGEIGIALVMTIFTAFLVLVFADLLQTLLDTATNTGVTAEASARNRPMPPSN